MDLKEIAHLHLQQVQVSAANPPASYHLHSTYTCPGGRCQGVQVSAVSAHWSGIWAFILLVQTVLPVFLAPLSI